MSSHRMQQSVDTLAEYKEESLKKDLGEEERGMKLSRQKRMRLSRRSSISQRWRFRRQ